MNKKIYNHMLDVAFTVEGPWEHYDQIPYEVLVSALEKRLAYLKSRGPEELDAFGHCDTYDVEYETNGFDGVGMVDQTGI